MRFNKTVGSVNIRINTDKLDRNIREAQKRLNMQIAADCDMYIPFQQGALRESLRYPEGLYGGAIEWDTPYAHYQYEGILYLTEDGRSFANKGERKYPTDIPLIQHTPGTSAHWFERARAENMNQWVELVDRTIGRGL